MQILNNPRFIAITILILCILWNLRPLMLWWSIHSLRKVTVTFKGGRTSSYIIHKWGLRNFVKAFVRLHYSPGINPHNGVTTTPITMITVALVCVHWPYWWTTPNLRGNGEWLLGGVPFVDELGHPKSTIIWHHHA